MITQVLNKDNLPSVLLEILLVCSPFGHSTILTAHVQLTVQEDPQVFFRKTLLQFPPCGCGLYPLFLDMTDLSVNMHIVCSCPLYQAIQITLYH